MIQLTAAMLAAADTDAKFSTWLVVGAAIFGVLAFILTFFTGVRQNIVLTKWNAYLPKEIERLEQAQRAEKADKEDLQRLEAQVKETAQEQARLTSAYHRTAQQLTDAADEFRRTADEIKTSISSLRSESFRAIGKVHERIDAMRDHAPPPRKA